MIPGIDFSKLHESEQVELQLPQPMPVRQAARTLRALGFKLREDVCSLPRQDAHQRHEQDSITDVSFMSAGVETATYLEDDDDDDEDEPEPECDLLVFDYLFAFLPKTLIPEFLSMLQRVQPAFGGILTHRGAPVEIAELETLFARYVTEIWEELAEEPGGDLLHRIIHESYPRR
ncbi:hypothetical protein [Prosthecobacter sp.]|uniref:hypothetical protein n=1 Tax=Prosthecobacter sp. TaxID=1965333 RepID=UPI0037843E52